MTKSRGILPPKVWWTPETEALLRELWPDNTCAVVAARLGFAMQRVYSKAHLLDLKKSAAFLASGKSGRLDGIRGGNTRFKTGQTSWNKGTHFTAGGRSAETRFKPGSNPVNRQEVGALRINADNIVDIKLWTGLRGWKQLSHYVWFIETGSWPPRGHVVRPRNDDPHDTRFENLELLTRQQNLARNYHDRYPIEFRRLVQIKGAISRQVNRLEREQTA